MNSEEPGRVRSRWKAVAWGVVGVAALLLFLFGLVVPPGRTVADSQISRTRALVQSLSVGLEAFKSDWGVYPPSSRRDGGAKDYGYQNLAYYLMGPTGEGWGAPVGGQLPLNGQSDHTYGPYLEDEAGKTTDGVLDAFRPPKPILYFRFDPKRDPPYDVHDNPVDPTCRTGFASREHFELSAKYRDNEEILRWQREDYLLISPGRDRLYGYVVEDEKTGGCRAATYRPATREDIEAGRAVWDDVTNFQ
ncbi:MAG TPA: hypothetical protein VM238_11225 [Phycisphaerae bacterium]|nr:hypothetical protein [Phycisphaerae bacterium]